MSCGGIFDIAQKIERLEEVNRELETPEVWNVPEKAQALSKERSQLVVVTDKFKILNQAIEDAAELLALVIEEQATDELTSLNQELHTLEQQLAALEFQRMFAGEMDSHHAYLDIQSGSGGVEAQDWAEMLLRMYLRWCERQGFATELLEVSPGEVAGIRSATIHVMGPYAFGWLRTEAGVHRLVRKSPFDSGNRRHTSFAAVCVVPEIDDEIAVTINPAELRVDTYRASGAGGQHVNRTDSAIRITHLPTGIVVQCQSDRSQHKNRAQAMKQLQAKLYELEMQKRAQQQAEFEANKADIGWGYQIRSYVLDASRIKDLRTGVEISDTQSVLDGNLNPFIQASLKQGIGLSHLAIPLREEP